MRIKIASVIRFAPPCQVIAKHQFCSDPDSFVFVYLCTYLFYAVLDKKSVDLKALVLEIYHIQPLIVVKKIMFKCFIWGFLCLEATVHSKNPKQKYPFQEHLLPDRRCIIATFLLVSLTAGGRREVTYALVTVPL